MGVGSNRGAGPSNPRPISPCVLLVPRNSSDKVGMNVEDADEEEVDGGSTISITNGATIEEMPASGGLSRSSSTRRSSGSSDSDTSMLVPTGKGGEQKVEDVEEEEEEEGKEKGGSTCIEFLPRSTSSPSS